MRTILAVVAGALAVFGVPLTTLLVAAAALAVGKRRALALLLLLAATPVALWEYPRRVDALVARGEALSTRDLAGIWVLNIGMALGGTCVGFPEVALETLLLTVPDGDGVRVFHSDFAMGSHRVRAAVDDYVALAEASGRDHVVLPPRRVTFGYPGGHSEWRVGLALNPVTLGGEAHREGDRWRLDLHGRVPVDYPDARLRLFPAFGRWIEIDEGLYDALERRGWLYPYTAEWRWTCSATGARS